MEKLRQTQGHELVRGITHTRILTVGARALSLNSNEASLHTGRTPWETHSKHRQSLPKRKD